MIRQEVVTNLIEGKKVYFDRLIFEVEKVTLKEHGLFRVVLTRGFGMKAQARILRLKPTDTLDLVG